jgi:hypothetical protein
MPLPKTRVDLYCVRYGTLNGSLPALLGTVADGQSSASRTQVRHPLFLTSPTK